ncbi:sugar transferase [Alphaproteobacteria bacterium]|nr:sugar transferase [Alphaproteobacteria bacterium]
MAKRVCDILISLIATIILIIPCVFISIFILQTSPGPVIYWSRRTGSNGTTFMMPKFRTMKIQTPEVATDKLSDPQKYLTPIGSFLRRSSIDELPQLFSVLIGDMSLVGPRPVLYNQYDIISKRKVLGIDILKPGITGWAQINGRDNISTKEKINLDYEYLKKQSIFFDIKIIFKTINLVIKKRNITH